MDLPGGRLQTKHQENISMLLAKLKEFSMSAESLSDGRIFGRIESNFLTLIFYTFC